MHAEKTLPWVTEAAAQVQARGKFNARRMDQGKGRVRCRELWRNAELRTDFLLNFLGRPRAVDFEHQLLAAE